jgi:uncharacterized membrane protein
LARQIRTDNERNLAQMEDIVSNVLRYGVLLSFAIILVGSVWLFLAGQTGYAGLHTSGKDAVAQLIDYRHGIHRPLALPQTPGEVFAGVGQAKPYAVIALGLLVLIATPVLRVAASVLTFLWERDLLYAFITAYVLTVLIVSFFLGKGG